MILAGLCHPPKGNPDFISEFSVTLTSPNIILLGDSNAHMDDDPLTKDFTSCLDSFGLQLHTHSRGHTLDLVCCSGVTPCNCTASDLTYLIFIFQHQLTSPPCLFKELQSGFHPTEIVLVKITNDLLMAADTGPITTILILNLIIPISLTN